MADLEDGERRSSVGIPRNESDLEVFVAAEGVEEQMPEPSSAAHALRWDTKQPNEEIAGLHVTIVGDRNKPALITFHDIGMNALSCFRKFLAYCAFDHPQECPQLFHTCQYHIEASGHHQLAQQIAKDSAWPTLDQIAEKVNEVVTHFGLKNVMCFGVGAGAEVLVRFTLAHREKVRSLLMVSPSLCAASYYERWCFQIGAGYKWLGSSSLPPDAKRLLLVRWFSEQRIESKHYEETVSIDLDGMQAENVMRFVYANAMRADVRHLLPKLDGIKTLLVLGKDSWMYDEAISAIPSLSPEDLTTIEIPHAGALPHIDQPENLARVVKLYLQGHSIVS
eukprot:CAMPEP_0185849216 /NCGR_PEP_ID=MMETSP1354-20130828/3788_1 /TAXON_ID=708628 /ORGANISM="Erythrolobus madagascarensis, Strain CCMP3276" /LENGTH=335 /DNA_ID=CAMNT_0028549699 /DNA_START=200 /DNA_END=1207 /DNA_ORIENTATION=-